MKPVREASKGKASRRCWPALAAAGLIAAAGALAAPPVAEPASTDLLARGRLIYETGMLPSGDTLKGMRFDNITVEGRAAACSTCHRPSGMGSVEGDNQVPPITGKYLFAQKGDLAVATMDVRRLVKSMNQHHAPYTVDSLANAIRSGVNNGGRRMNVMMPRFNLGDEDMAALTAYLTQLSGQWSPGISGQRIRFATVVAPGVDPARSKAMLDVLRAAFAQKNGSTHPGQRHMVSAAEMIYRTERFWDLDVWPLRGDPSTWAAQLEAYYRRQPVFALVSGLSEGTWEPVYQFCDQEKLPCWFPSVDLPPAMPNAAYSLNFTRGVALDADVLARYLGGGKARPQRLVQIFADDDIGRGGAAELARALEGSGIRVESRKLGEAGSAELKSALSGITGHDAVMLWLRSEQLAGLDGIAPPAAVTYFSGRLTGEHAALPAAWKRRANLVYPYQMPDRRGANLETFRGWMKLRHMPVVDEPLQSEAYFAVDFLSATLSEMLDNLYRDYLIERAEQQLSFRESSVAEMETWGATAEARSRFQHQLGKKDGTSIYPRLSLAPGERVASFGGYIVRYADGARDDLVATSDWIVP